MSAEENKTMASNEPDALTDEQLDEVAGGWGESIEFCECTMVSCSKGIIGYVEDKGFLKDNCTRYWPCPKCGMPMHRGALNLAYCDPCNEKRFANKMNSSLWQGGDGIAEDLIDYAETGKTYDMLDEYNEL